MQPPEKNVWATKGSRLSRAKKKSFHSFISLGLPVTTTLQGVEWKGVSKMEACNLDIDCTYWKSGKVKLFAKTGKALRKKNPACTNATPKSREVWRVIGVLDDLPYFLPSKIDDEVDRDSFCV